MGFADKPGLLTVSDSSIEGLAQRIVFGRLLEARVKRSQCEFSVEGLAASLHLDETAVASALDTLIMGGLLVMQSETPMSHEDTYVIDSIALAISPVVSSQGTLDFDGPAPIVIDRTVSGSYEKTFETCILRCAVRPHPNNLSESPNGWHEVNIALVPIHGTAPEDMQVLVTGFERPTQDAAWEWVDQYISTYEPPATLVPSADSAKEAPKRKRKPKQAD